jgi:hypothetical protein
VSSKRSRPRIRFCGNGAWNQGFEAELAGAARVGFLFNGEDESLTDAATLMRGKNVDVVDVDDRFRGKG